MSSHHESPLGRFLSYGNRCSQALQIDLLRFLLHQCNLIDNPEDDSFPLTKWHMLWFLNPETKDWLWNNVTSFFSDQQVLDIQCSLLQSMLWDILETSSSEEQHDKVARFVERASPETIQRYVQGKFSLMGLIMMPWHSLDSQGHGTMVLEVLRSLNLDIQACISMEVRLWPERRFDGFQIKKKLIVFEPLDDQNWRLQWVWDLDPHAPGYLLVSEHIGLGPETFVGSLYTDKKGYFIQGDRWPFSSAKPRFDFHNYHIKGTQWENRFKRREARKARKERARNGQKITRSRLPGAWNW